LEGRGEKERRKGVNGRETERKERDGRKYRISVYALANQLRRVNE